MTTEAKIIPQKSAKTATNTQNNPRASFSAGEPIFQHNKVQEIQTHTLVEHVCFMP